MNILVVEDQFLLASLLADTLSDAGHNVVGPAATQDEALDALRLTPADLALVDVELRGGDSGIVLAQELRRLRVPTVFASAQTKAARDSRDLAVGLLAKPYAPRLLLEVVTWIETWALNGGPASRPPLGFELFDDGLAPVGRGTSAPLPKPAVLRGTVLMRASESKVH